MQQSRDILNDRAGVNTVDSALDARTVEGRAVEHSHIVKLHPAQITTESDIDLNDRLM